MTEVQVKERPILFSAAMVKALLAGDKTQTRRAIKWPLKANSALSYGAKSLDIALENGLDYRPDDNQPNNRGGDRLYVKEAYRTLKEYDRLKPSELPADAPVYYEADGLTRNGHWGRYRHALFMPRRLSRLLLEITDVRVERVQDISEADALAEGVGSGWCMNAGYPDYEHIDKNGQCTLTQDTAAASYGSLWCSINGPDSWAANPWCWVIEFKVTK